MKKKTGLIFGLLLLALLYSVGAFGQTTWPRPSETRPVTQGGDWTISHIGSTVHVTGSLTATVDTIRHISAVTHVAGYGTFQVRQHDVSRLAHISSVTHVAGYGTFDVRQHGTSTLAHISSTTHIMGVIRSHYSGAMRAWHVGLCGTNAAMAVASNEGRRDLILSNRGGASNNADQVVILIGYGTTGHVALTATNGFPLALHFQATATGTAFASTPPLVLRDYQGPVACITNQGAATLGVIEILR